MQTGLTSFQQTVFAALKKIPRGKVTTYKYLAEAINCKSSQAVGQALKNNPFAPEVPCHRVIRSDLSIGGYVGQVKGDEIRRKLNLLQAEGVEFVDGRLKEKSRLIESNLLRI